MQFKTMLHAATPRVKCPEHGVTQARVPWPDGSRRFTLLFERFAIDVLLTTQNLVTILISQGINIADPLNSWC